MGRGEVGRFGTVHRIEASAHEPLLILGIAACERTAHDDQIYLVRLVTYLGELRYAVQDLSVRIELVPAGTPGRGLLTGV